MKHRTLRRRYGRSVDEAARGITAAGARGALIPPSSYGLVRHDLGNNEAYSTGISFNRYQEIPWLALTGTQSKWLRTFGGAVK